jgi:hypothetical protein
VVGSHIRTVFSPILIFDTEQRQFAAIYALNDVDGSPASHDVAAYDLYNACEHDGDPFCLAETKNPPSISAGGRK